jgi:hypothetical protein
VAAIARHDDGDTAAVLAIEQTQHGLQKSSPSRPGRSAQSTRRSMIVQPPEPHRSTWRAARDAPIPARRAIARSGRGSRKPRDRRLPDGLDPEWRKPDGSDYFQR